MSDDNKLDLILAKLGDMQQDISELKQDVSVLKQDVSVLKQDVSVLKQDVLRISLHLENVTDRNIALLAENHGSLIDKLNQSIKAADKTAVYEVQVSALSYKVEKLEREVSEIKNRIA